MIDGARLRSGLLAILVLLVALVGSAEFFGWIYLRHVVELDWRPTWQGPPLEDRRIGPWRVAHAAWGNWRIANARPVS